MASRSTSKRVPNPELWLHGVERLGATQYLPPLPDPLIGRSQERIHAHRRLEQDGVVAITGIAGSGKTALATVIAQESQRSIIWIEVAPGLNDSVEALLWQLAQPLSRIVPAAWHTLHQHQQAGWGYPPMTRLQIILDSYVASNAPCIVCIDRLDRVTDSGQESLIIALCDYLARAPRSGLRAIVVGGMLPDSLEAYALPALAGLSPDEIVDWAHVMAVRLSLEDATAIVELTGGLPQPIKALLAALFVSADPPALHQLIDRREIRRFVTDVLSSLSNRERALLTTLIRQPTPRFEWSYTALTALKGLERRSIVTQPAVDTFVIHPLVRRFLEHYGPPL